LVSLRAPDAEVSLAGNSNGSGVAGARGWIREVGGSGAVAVATLTDSAGHRISSAPLHLSALWQTFGVTDTTIESGALRLSIGAASRWPSGTRIELASVLADATGKTTLTRVPGTNEFTLTPAGEHPRPFLAHGYVYWPYPIGDELGAPWAIPATCQADAQILRGLGVTMIEMPAQSAGDPGVMDNPWPVLRKCADSFWAAGIGIAWLFPINNDFVNVSVNEAGVSKGVGGATFVSAWEAFFHQVIGEFGDHPATEIWLVGNEMNQNGRDSQCFFDYAPGAGPCTDVSGGHWLSQLVDYLHSNDPGHPVSTKIAGQGGDCGSDASANLISPENVPHLDFWSVDEYPGSSFGGAFTCLQREDPTRPVLMSEFGNARLYCPGKDSLSYTSGYTTDLACPPGSHEDDAIQTSANTGLWRDIVAAEATPENPQGELLGGAQFMYSDLWWLSLVGPPVAHDAVAYGWTSGPNGWLAIEWEGAAQAQLASQSGEPRVTTPEMASIAAVWGSVAPPDDPPITGWGRLPLVSDVAISPAATPSGVCAVRASWTTAEPATSRVDWGVTQLVTGPTGDLLADNTEYTDSQETDKATTHHDLVMRGPFVPGATYRFAVRSFDANYASDASAGVDVTIPLGTCR
jgi:hypothetical protein